MITALDTIEQSAHHSFGQGKSQLLDIGGGYGITTQYEKPGILDQAGKPVIGLAQFETTYLDGKVLFLALARGESDQDFSAATLPKTRLLILGKRFFELFNNPSHEVQMGYRQAEAVDMILGHELTHIRLGQLNDVQQGVVDTFYANNWVQVHSFAQELMKRDDYRKKIIESTVKAKQSNPEIKTRTVVSDGQKYEVAVHEIVDELLAFSSAGTLIDNNRLAQLATINPTKEFQCRERLSVVAIDTLNKIRQISKTTTPLPGEDLHQGLRSLIDLIKLSIPKLLAQQTN